MWHCPITVHCFPIIRIWCLMQLSSVLPLSQMKPLTIWKKRTLNIVIPGHMMIRHREKKQRKNVPMTFLRYWQITHRWQAISHAMQIRRSISPETIWAVIVRWWSCFCISWLQSWPLFLRWQQTIRLSKRLRWSEPCGLPVIQEKNFWYITWHCRFWSRL